MNRDFIKTYFPWLLVIMLTGLLIWSLYGRMNAYIRSEEYRQEAVGLQEELYRLRARQDSLYGIYRTNFVYNKVQGRGELVKLSDDSIWFGAHTSASSQKFVNSREEYIVVYENFDTLSGFHHPLDTFWNYDNRLLSVPIDYAHDGQLTGGIHVNHIEGPDFMLPFFITLELRSDK